MIVSDVLKNVFTTFKTYWTFSDIAWPNKSFDSSAQGLTKWVRLSVIFADNDKKDIGADTSIHRQFGVVVLEIFVDQNSGAVGSVDLVELAKTYFYTLNIPGVTFQSPDIQYVGPAEGWFQQNVVCNFFTDNIV